MKLYRWMGKDEFLKMQQGKTIIGKDFRKTKNTTSNGVCFFPEEILMKKVFEEYSNIDVNPKELSPEEIINLDDFSANFNVANSLELLSGIVDKDVFVEFEVDDKNVIHFLDTNNLEEKPSGKVLETWGVYATPYGGFFDKVLAFEYSILSYNKEILKPTRFMTFDIFHEANDELDFNDFIDYSDDAKLERDLFIKIDNSNITEYSDLFDLRQNYGEKIASDLILIKQNNGNEFFERELKKDFYLMFKDGANYSQILDVCCYALSQDYFKENSYVKEFNLELEDFKYSILDSLDYVQNLIDRDKSLDYIYTEDILRSINSIYLKENNLADDYFLKRINLDKEKEKASNCIRGLLNNNDTLSKEIIVNLIINTAEEKGWRFVSETPDKGFSLVKKIVSESIEDENFLEK